MIITRVIQIYSNVIAFEKHLGNFSSEKTHGRKPWDSVRIKLAERHESRSIERAGYVKRKGVKCGNPIKIPRGATQRG